MKTKINTLLFSLGTIVALTSCGGAGKENPSGQTGDSLEIHNTQLQRSAKLFKEAALPFTVDTAFIFKIAKGDSLGGFEIKSLATTIFKHSLTEGLQDELNTFYKIDSLKEVGAYKMYCDSMDIGMTKYFTAHALNEFHLDANTLILVWGLRSSSYEACPYSEAQNVYFTIVYKGDVGETFLLGESSTWADAPVSSERTVTSKLAADGTLTVDVLQINDQDPDSTTVEVSREQNLFTIKDGVIKFVSNKPGQSGNEKRKK
jgi:hypothetical protein